MKTYHCVRQNGVVVCQVTELIDGDPSAEFGHFGRMI